MGAAGGGLVSALGLAGRVAFAWLLVVAVSFALIRALPGDPVAIFLANAGVAANETVLAQYRAAWGLDRPLVVQFGDWLTRFVRLDWGAELVSGRPVRTEVLAGLPWSFAIGCGGLGLAGLIGTLLGFAAALRPRGLADRVSRAFAVGAQAIPAFAVGLGLLWWFSVEWRLVRPFSGAMAERLVLPVALVALFSVGTVARVTRSAFAEVAGEPYFATALAKGLPPRTALWRHGRRHAAIVLLAALSPELAWAVGGTIVAEVVFAVPGVSTTLLDAVAERDYGALQAAIAVIALWIVVVLTAARALRRRLDPRGT